MAAFSCAGLWACASYFRAGPTMPLAEPADTAFQVHWESRGVKGLTLDDRPVPGKGVQAVPLAAESCEGSAQFAGTMDGANGLPLTVRVPRRPIATAVEVALDSTQVAAVAVHTDHDTAVFSVPEGSQPKITVTTECAAFCRFTGVSRSGAAGPHNTVIASSDRCWQGETVSIMSGDSRRYRITPLLRDSTVAGPPLFVVLRQAER